MNARKELTEVLKQSLNENEEFREAYNKLTDEEKDNLKNRYLEGFELHNALVKNNNKSLEDLEKVAHELLRKTLLERGYKKTYGKKAKIYTLNRVFTYKIQDYIVGLKITSHFKKGYNCSFMVLLEIPTPKGRVYADLRGTEYNDNDNSLAYAIYTAHFFDRYKERLGLTGDREAIIDKFIKEELSSIKRGSDLEQKGYKVMYNLSQGLALGVSCADGVLLKTFISNNEVNSYQKKKKEELEDMMLWHDLEDEDFY